MLVIFWISKNEQNEKNLKHESTPIETGMRRKTNPVSDKLSGIFQRAE